MSPTTRGPFGRFTAGMHLVSRGPSHFDSGRRYLVAEGLLSIAVGIAGFVSVAMHPGFPPTGATVLFLTLTPWQSVILVGFGIVAVAGSLRRGAAITVTAVAAVAFVLLAIIGAVAAAHHDPGPLGFDTADIVLHGVLASANFALLYWLIPDVLEGPDWVSGSRAESQGSAKAHSRG